MFKHKAARRTKKALLHCVQTATLSLPGCLFLTPPAEAVPFSKNKPHKISINSRTRVSLLEDTTADNQLNSGKAVSTRARFEIDSQWTKHWFTHLQIEHIERSWKEDHSDGVSFNGKPSIPDTEGSGIKQIQINYRSRDLEFDLGKMTLNYDDERFIGSVSFWQNEQTFDSVGIKRKFLSNSSFRYNYLDKAHRIFGRDAGRTLSETDLNYEALDGERPLNRLGEHTLNSHLFQFNFKEWDYHEFTLFSYKIKNLTGKRLSNTTNGVHYKFSYKPNTIKYRIELTGAHQERSQIANAPDNQYYSAELGVGHKTIEISTRYELLSANQKQGQKISFITPLASLHEFQGWADHFVTTPQNGIEDIAFGFSWRKAPWKLNIKKHYFFEALGGNAYGQELDLDFLYKFAKNQNIHLRLAYFSDSEHYQSVYTDRSRLFLTYSLSLP